MFSSICPVRESREAVPAPDGGAHSWMGVRGQGRGDGLVGTNPELKERSLYAHPTMRFACEGHLQDRFALPLERDWRPTLR